MNYQGWAQGSSLQFPSGLQSLQKHPTLVGKIHKKISTFFSLKVAAVGLEHLNSLGPRVNKNQSILLLLSIEH